MIALPRLTPEVAEVVATDGSVSMTSALLAEDPESAYACWIQAVELVADFKEAYGLTHAEFVAAVRRDVQLLAEEATSEPDPPPPVVESIKEKAIRLGYVRKAA